MAIKERMGSAPSSMADAKEFPTQGLEPNGITPRPPCKAPPCRGCRPPCAGGIDVVSPPVNVSAKK